MAACNNSLVACSRSQQVSNFVRVWAAFLKNHVFGKKSKQIRSVVFSRGRRHSSHGNANEFLPKGSRVRKSICQPSLHRRGKTEVRDVWECRLSASTQRCLQGTLQFPGFVLLCFCFVFFFHPACTRQRVTPQWLIMEKSIPVNGT